jgi:ABC-type polysaccharide/polyol phosphate export permease
MQTAQHMLRTGRRGALHEFAMAATDLRNSTLRIGLAWSLAWHDVVSRYRGSILGPFWITLSMGLMVLGISFVYSHLFDIPLNDFMPFVACGIVFWGVIAGTITEGCDTFVQASGMLSQTSLPMLTFVWRAVLRSVINLAHHIVIVVAVLAWYGTWRQANAPLALAGLLLVLINIAWITLAVAIASARFRDIPQIVGSITQFAIFLTPVFWQARGKLLDHALLMLNPFYHMLDAVRAPLLGHTPTAQTYLTLAGMAVVGWGVTFTVFAFTRRRIVHYL